MDPIADAMMDLDVRDSTSMGFVDMTRMAVSVMGDRFTRRGWADGREVSVTDRSYPNFEVYRTLKDKEGAEHKVSVPWFPNVGDILATDWRRVRCRTGGRRSSRSPRTVRRASPKGRSRPS